MPKADGAAGSVRRREGAPSGPTTTDAADGLVPTGQWTAGPVHRVAAPLREQVFDVLRQAILDADLQPGQRLIERQLVEDLGASRTTVREVLARLASEGLVTVIPQRGAIVSVLSSAEAADIYEMRIALESLAVERFVERAAPEQVRELRLALGGYARAVRHKAGEADALRAKDAFYEVLLAGANSPPLAETLTMLQGRVRLLRATSLSVPDRPAASVRELTELVDAIEQRDVALGDRGLHGARPHRGADRNRPARRDRRVLTRPINTAGSCLRPPSVADRAQKYGGGASRTAIGSSLQDAQQQVRCQHRPDRSEAVAEPIDDIAMTLQLQTIIKRVAEAVCPVEERQHEKAEKSQTCQRETQPGAASA